MRIHLLYSVVLVCLTGQLRPAEASELPEAMIGYTEYQTNLSGGRHANVRTMRAVVAAAKGASARKIAEELADDPDAWTQFAGWSPDGTQAIVARGWQDPENAAWEGAHHTFRMDPGKWLLDSYLVDLQTGQSVNVTGVDRVSHYNGGLFFLPDARALGFTPLINGVSKPFLMDPDGHNKRDVSGEGGGFAYGYSAAPDGKQISYHENYQIFIADADGSNKHHIATGNPFNFGPKWSADGEWLLFVSGEHGKSHPYVVRRDGSELKKLADLNGYQGWILFLDVEDFHQGSSDIPAWSVDGKSVFYTAAAGASTELFRATLSGEITQITNTPEGTLHYHATPSPDGKWLLYGSRRAGIRQLFVQNLATRDEYPLTHLPAGRGAMWPHWQPTGHKAPIRRECDLP